MAQWGTPEYTAEMHRQQLVRDAQFRQQQESNARFAAAQKAREVQQTQQREAQAKFEAFSAGVNGDVHSTSKYTQHSSYMAGAATGGRNPFTGKSWFEPRQSKNTEAADIHTGAGFGARNTKQQCSGTPNKHTKSIGLIWIYVIVTIGLLVGISSILSSERVSNSASRKAQIGAPSAQTAVTPLEPFTHYVTARKLNVRKGPGTDYIVLGTKSKNGCIRVVGNAPGPWVKVAVPTSMGNRVYYTSSKYLRPLRPGAQCR